MKHKPFTLDIPDSVIPVRTAEWYEEEGLVRIKMQKFEGGLGRWLCRVLKKPTYAVVNLDEQGSFIWRRCDGATSVGCILDDLRQETGERFEKEGLRHRSYFFLRMLHSRGLISLRLSEPTPGEPGGGKQGPGGV